MQTSTHKKWEPFCWECDQDSRTPSLFVSYSHALTDTHTHTHTHRGHIMQWYSCFKQTYIQWSHITLRLFIDMPSLVHIVRRELMRKRVNPYEMHSFNSQTFIHILTKMLYETPDYCNKCLVTLKEWSREEQSDLNGRKEQTLLSIEEKKEAHAYNHLEISLYGRDRALNVMHVIRNQCQWMKDKGTMIWQREREKKEWIR